LARQLVDQMTRPFQPEQFPKQWQQAFQDLLERKLRGEEAVRPAVPREEPAVSDLLAALEKSLKELEPQPVGRS